LFNGPERLLEGTRRGTVENGKRRNHRKNGKEKNLYVRESDPFLPFKGGTCAKDALDAL